MSMRNWSEADLTQVDLATLSAEDRHGLYAEVERRARSDRARALREAVTWLRRVVWQPKQPRSRDRVYVPEPRGPLDLIFGGRA
jgi:hypothetical protein